MDLTNVQNLAAAIRNEVGKAVVGQSESVDLLLTALMSNGHILLEGVPGTAKTLLVRTFAAALSLDFGRVQFTPDLMPGDVLGTNLFNFQTNEFKLTRGPIFTDLLLADEINRTPPKTQAALLEAMQERSVTIDGTTHVLGNGFMVIATQNPVEQQGTYPLPEAQLDRFLFMHVLGYPERNEERAIVTQHGHRSGMASPADLGVSPVADLDRIKAARADIAQIRLNEAMIDYLVDIIRATREHPALEFGASPRSAAVLATAIRAYAALQGREFAIPDDVKVLALPALRHRVVLSPAAEIEGQGTDQAILNILDTIPAPR